METQGNKTRKKKWPGKNLGELINFLEEQYPDGIPIKDVAERLGVTQSSISQMFRLDDTRLSKAEWIAGRYGYRIDLFFPKRKYEDGYVPAKPRMSYPDAGNLLGLVNYIQDSEYTITFVAEKTGVTRGVFTKAFQSGDISISLLYQILDILGLCVIWKFTKIEN